MDKIKTKLKKGDNVIVVSGKDKGKSGSILSIFPTKNKAIVKGINIVKKHQKPDNNQAGGITDKEMPIHISNLAFFDSKNNKGVKLGYKFDSKNKKNLINILLIALYLFCLLYTSPSPRD